MKHLRRIAIIVASVAVAWAIYQAMQPQPLKVDLAEVQRGVLRVTVDEDGKTRIKERYVVSAPLAGRLLRINKDPGDKVTLREAALATIEPSDPQLLDPRELAAAEARERAAKARVQRTDPLLAAAHAELNFAESELARQRDLEQSGAASKTVLQNAERLYLTASQNYRAATFATDIARYELEQAQAALMPSRHENGKPNADAWRFVVDSPIAGTVLRVFQESADIVTPGTPLVEVGDPTDLELEIDVLSSDAVKIQAGAEVVIEHWGGAHPLRGSVRLVEPSAFTKISALGVEEQRVNVIIDIDDPVAQRPTLGDGFRVEVRIVVWEGQDILQVPTSAVFREGQDWVVFTKQDGKASRHIVELGHRNTDFAEILAGLQLGDQVIVHPNDQIAEGVMIQIREE